MRASMVGTTKAWVTSSARAAAIQASAEKTGNGTMRRPDHVADSTAATPAM